MPDAARIKIVGPHANNSASDVPEPGTGGDLRSAEQLIRDERRRMVRERWMHLLLLGFALSVIVHVAIMLRLAVLQAPESGSPGSPDVAVSLQELPPQIEVSPDVDLPDPTPAAVGPISTEVDPLPNLSTEIASNDPTQDSIGTIEAPGIGAIVGPGGAGSGIGVGSGKGGGTSFFGVGGRGTRFAYIVDISGSMEEDGRIVTAMSELKRSISALPDYAEFYVVLFSDGAVLPEWQEGWQRASRGNVARMRRWIEEQDTRGGTVPMGAIEIVFRLPIPPDVVFFLTDGLIPGNAVVAFQDCIARARSETVVHTIGFSSEAGREPLIQIAKNHRGVFRFVPSRPRPRGEQQ